MYDSLPFLGFWDDSIHTSYCMIYDGECMVSLLSAQLHDGTLPA